MARDLTPGECFGNLLRDPFGGRVMRSRDPDKLAPSQPDNNQNVEQVKAEGRRHERVHDCHLRQMVAQECASALTRRAETERCLTRAGNQVAARNSSRSYREPAPRSDFFKRRSRFARRLNESFATETLCVPKTSFHVNVAGRETIMSAMQLGFEL